MSFEGFIYTEIGLIAAYALTLAAIAVGWLPVTRTRLKLAQYCFYVVAALVAGVAIFWGTQAEMGWLPKSLIVGIICAGAGATAAQTGRFLSAMNAPVAVVPLSPASTMTGGTGIKARGAKMSGVLVEGFETGIDAPDSNIEGATVRPFLERRTPSRLTPKPGASATARRIAGLDRATEGRRP